MKDNIVLSQTANALVRLERKDDADLRLVAASISIDMPMRI